MKTLDLMNMVALEIKELSEAVTDHMKAQKEIAGGVPSWQVVIPPRAKKEAIKRRITQIRQDLMEVERSL